MADVEVSGKTVEEAIEDALAELSESDPDGRVFGRGDVEIEVLSQGRAGVLGVGAEPARVRVRQREDAVPAAAGHGAADASGAGSAGPAAIDAAADAPAGDEYVEDEAEIAAQTLDKMLEMMGVRADVSIRDAETPGDGLGMVKAVLDIEGEDLGLLIGRRGETLASMQYLLNLMMSRQFGERLSFTVDVEGYRRRRERQLNTLARRMADQVKRTRRPVTLEPMPPNERRIIHMALAEDRYVTTASSGEGDARQISISPR
ncbi:MAG: protein jag [Dehalococcoidia bacterium]|nr:protein jag [Dehalococcoidia bacterium]